MTKNTAPKATKTAKAKKANKKDPLARRFGTLAQRHNLRRKVVSLRTKQRISWAAIAQELDITPRMARKLFDELKGAETHYEDRLEGKGGRIRKVVDTTATEEA